MEPVQAAGSGLLEVLPAVQVSAPSTALVVHAGASPVVSTRLPHDRSLKVQTMQASLMRPESSVPSASPVTAPLVAHGGATVISGSPTAMTALVHGHSLVTTTFAGTQASSPVYSALPRATNAYSPMQVLGQVSAPSYPSRSTAGMPDPAAIDRQKKQYLQTLEEQEREAVAMLDEQRQQRVNFIRHQGEQHKRAFALQVDQEAQAKDMAITQQHSQQMMMLNQQYAQQRGILENQAHALIMEHNQAKAKEEVMLQNQRLGKEQYDAKMRQAQEMARVQQEAAQIGAVVTGPMPVVIPVQTPTLGPCPTRAGAPCIPVMVNQAAITPALSSAPSYRPAGAPPALTA